MRSLVGRGDSKLLTGEQNKLISLGAQASGASSNFMMATDRYLKHIAHDAKRTAILHRFKKFSEDYSPTIVNGQKTAYVIQQIGNLRMTEDRFKSHMKGVTITTVKPDKSTNKVQVTEANLNKLLEKPGDVSKHLDQLFEFALENDAQAYAEHGAFQDQMQEGMKNAVKIRNKWGAIGRVIMPFMSTQAVLLQRGIELTPVLGVVLGSNKIVTKKGTIPLGFGATGDARLSPKEYAISTVSKQIQGMAITMLVWNMVESGFLTGPPPEDRAERDAFFRSGKISHGFKFTEEGDWISYRRIEPFSFPFSLLIDIKNRWDKAETEGESVDLFSSAIKVANDHILDGSLMRGLNDALSGRTDKLAWLASGLVPYSGFWRGLNAQWQAAESGQIAVRERRTFMDTFGQSIPPGLPEAFGLVQPGDTIADPKLDVFGQEVFRPTNIFQEWLPIKWQTSEVDPVEQELQNLKLYPGLPSRNMTYRGEVFELDDEDYRDLITEAGPRLKERYKSFMTTPGYITQDRDKKAKRLQKERDSIYTRERNRLKRKLSSEGKFEDAS